MSMLTPKALAAYLAEPRQKQQIDAALQSLAEELASTVAEHGARLRQQTGLPAELADLVLAGGMVDVAVDVRTQLAARTRARGSSLAMIATATGLKPTTNPRLWVGFDELVDADQWAREHPGEAPEPVQGTRVTMSVSPYPPAS